MTKSVFALLIPILVIASMSSAEEPEYKRWNLEFEHATPNYLAFTDALGQRHICWYVTYKVTNQGDKDVPLGIQISATTEDDKAYLDSISPLAQKALEEKTGKKFKNALEMRKGKIAPNETIDAVAFLGALDPNFDYLYIKVAGLYDTIDQVDGRIFFEKKVLIVTYYRPGDEFDAANDEITKKSEKWKIEEREEIPQTPKE